MLVRMCQIECETFAEEMLGFGAGVKAFRPSAFLPQPRPGQPRPKPGPSLAQAWPKSGPSLAQGWDFSKISNFQNLSLIHI